ncbi:MAG: hypothetical protein ACI808_001099 [Paraglaciecola sp.]
MITVAETYIQKSTPSALGDDFCIQTELRQAIKIGNVAMYQLIMYISESTDNRLKESSKLISYLIIIHLIRRNIFQFNQ